MDHSYSPEYASRNHTESAQRRKCTPMTTRSFALARLRRHREAFLDPRLPQRFLAGDGSGRLIAVKVDVQRNHALAAEVEGAKGGYARPRLVEPQQDVVRTLADVLRHTTERRDTRGRRPTLPDAQAFQSQCRGKRFPGLRFRTRDTRHELHDRGALAAEVREIDPQGAEEAGPAGFGAFELVVPVVGAGEEAVHHADAADASRAGFDAPFGRDGRHLGRPTGGFRGEHPG